MGGLEEYLKYKTLRLFTDYYYLHTSLGNGYSVSEYFRYIIEEFHLLIIPFVVAILYLIAHKIVDRSVVEATKRLNFFYFFFIFGISNILSGLFANGVFRTITEINIPFVFGGTYFIR